MSLCAKHKAELSRCDLLDIRGYECGCERTGESAVSSDSKQDFILWAKSQGARRVKIGDVEMEFFAPVMIPVSVSTQPLPKDASWPEKFPDAIPTDPKDPNSVHTPECRCEDCCFLFGMTPQQGAEANG